MIREIFRTQGDVCAELGSSFTGSLCHTLADQLNRDTAIGSLCLNWAGEAGPSGDSVPLRLCGGLHALALTGESTELARLYPPATGGALSDEAVSRALQEHEAFLLNWMKSPPQTNEVSRSAVLWPSMMAIARLTDLPLSLLEVGASAGLNLNLDRFHYSLGNIESGERQSPLQLAPQWRGRPAVAHPVQIHSRCGCDLAPIDILDPVQLLRLRSYVWADQTERKTRLDAAVDIAQRNPPRVAKMDAVDWLKTVLPKAPDQACTVVYSTIAWQYLPLPARKAGEQVVAQAASQSSSSRPLAWLRFEADGESPGAGIRLQLWPQNLDINLGRGDFHGRWVDWNGV